MRDDAVVVDAIVPDPSGGRPREGSERGVGTLDDAGLLAEGALLGGIC